MYDFFIRSLIVIKVLFLIIHPKKWTCLMTLGRNTGYLYLIGVGLTMLCDSDSGLLVSSAALYFSIVVILSSVFYDKELFKPAFYFVACVFTSHWSYLLLAKFIFSLGFISDGFCTYFAVSLPSLNIDAVTLEFCILLYINVICPFLYFAFYVFIYDNYHRCDYVQIVSFCSLICPKIISSNRLSCLPTSLLTYASFTFTLLRRNQVMLRFYKLRPEL